MVDVKLSLMVLSAVITLAYFSDTLFNRTKIPDIIWLLAMGVLIGPIGHLVDVSYLVALSPLFSAITIIAILFDSGINMNIQKLFREVPQGAVLAITGFLISASAAAIPALLYLKLQPIEAILLGCIVGGTNSSIVLAKRKKGIVPREKVGTLLDIEDILTDPLTLIVPIVILQSIKSGKGFDFSFAASSILANFSTSLIIGIIAGVIWSLYQKNIRETRGYFGITMSSIFLLFSVTEYLGGNGALSCFIFGLVIGNSQQIAKGLGVTTNVAGVEEETRKFSSMITFFSRAFFFVLLGATVTMGNPFLFLLGVGISLFIFMFRRLIISFTIKKGEFTDAERELMAFTIPRGLGAAIMAPLPAIQYGLAHLSMFTEVIFSVIISTMVLTSIGMSRFSSSSSQQRAAEPKKPIDHNPLFPHEWIQEV